MWVDLTQVEVGNELPELKFGPVSRTALALYCGGSGDHNPMHVDVDFAKNAGLDDVFAHGMLSMGVLSRMLTEWAPQDQLREFGVRFAAITPVNATVTCTGKVVEITEIDNERQISLEATSQIDDGTVTLVGFAVVAIPA